MAHTQIIRIFEQIFRLGFLNFDSWVKLACLNKPFRSYFHDNEKILNILMDGYIQACNRNTNRWVNSKTKRFEFWYYCVMTSEVRKYFGNMNENDRFLFYKTNSIISPTSSTLSSGIIGEILRDVRRTFPTHSFFKIGERGSVMLTRVLKAFSSARPDIGYVRTKILFLAVFINPGRTQ